ncbi:MAG: hypothetical protein CVV13_13575 [Gammaproteobacteria bacterium HGW-Gammaproteobacteria-3]|nr:MAG: hypothetical protein CVV13_13575 [Gammaproteobacteria bacterium HGW-Gammaproteobacteria-3]
MKGLLLEGHFGGVDDALSQTDPLSTTQLVLHLDDIKASILGKKQLNNNFNVTRKSVAGLGYFLFFFFALGELPWL